MEGNEIGRNLEISKIDRRKWNWKEPGNLNIRWKEMELVYGVFFIFVGSFQFHFLPFVFEISRLLPILSKPMLLVYLASFQHNPYPFSSTKFSFFSSSFSFSFFPSNHFFSLLNKKMLPGYDFGNALLPGTAGTRGTHFLSPCLSNNFFIWIFLQRMLIIKVKRYALFSRSMYSE